MKRQDALKHDIEQHFNHVTTPLYSSLTVSPFDLISQCKMREFIEFVRDNQQRIHEFRGVVGRTLLHYAVIYNNEYAVRLLLDAGFQLQTLDKAGNTALHCAAREGMYQMVRALMVSQSFSACLSINNNQSVSPLDMFHEDNNLPKDILSALPSQYRQKKLTV